MHKFSIGISVHVPYIDFQGNACSCLDWFQNSLMLTTTTNLSNMASDSQILSPGQLEGVLISQGISVITVSLATRKACKIFKKHGNNERVAAERKEEKNNFVDIWVQLWKKIIHKFFKFCKRKSYETWKLHVKRFYSNVWLSWYF